MVDILRIEDLDECCGKKLKLDDRLKTIVRFGQSEDRGGYTVVWFVSIEYPNTVVTYYIQMRPDLIPQENGSYLLSLVREHGKDDAFWRKIAFERKES